MSAKPQTHGRYVVDRVLGQGGEGIAYVVRHNLALTSTSDSMDSIDVSGDSSGGGRGGVGSDDTCFVMKRRTCYSQEEANVALQEALAMARISSPYCIPLRDVFVEQAPPEGEENPTGAHSYVFIVSDFCDSGDLLDLIVRIQEGEQEPLSIDTLRTIMFDVTRALFAVHEAALQHRDVKPENVFASSNGRYLLGDFGVASSQRVTSETAGTYHYFAPEIMDKSKQLAATNAIDVWALGVVALELASGKLLRSFRKHPLGIEVMDDSFDIGILMKTAIASEEVRDEIGPFLRACFERAPEKRSSIKVLLGSPFFSPFVRKDSSIELGSVGGLVKKRATPDMCDQVSHFFATNLLDLQPFTWVFEPLAQQISDRKTLIETCARTMWRFEIAEFLRRKQIIVLLDNGVIVAARAMIDHREKVEFPVGQFFRLLKEMRKDDNNHSLVLRRMVRNLKWLNHKVIPLAKQANGGKLSGINMVFYWVCDPNFRTQGEMLLDDICARCDEEGIMLATVTGDEGTCRSYVERGAEVTKVTKGLASKGLKKKIDDQFQGWPPTYLLLRSPQDVSVASTTNLDQYK